MPMINNVTDWNTKLIRSAAVWQFLFFYLPGFSPALDSPQRPGELAVYTSAVVRLIKDLQ